ncbi:hypothetical protein NF27_DA00030 [Candidatus Jidaibacter acanthamoeba]|uniref:Transposase DDE domain-containing protein n=1 Tax=Candidatus Jidaibacter acanthamoebae TaxID=86105 RepID=A0A0C1QJQ1_9RICK|nr:hypothetical protein [Candidatus Jidaibacter acanthamoeba]KIE05739.1 hypothetical protein NF27_DA00030 [Candidatus Jidaibacter acanthamoeba]
MKYYIEERIWEQIYEFLGRERGLHRNKEGRLMQFIEGVWYIVQCCKELFIRFFRIYKQE